MSTARLDSLTGIEAALWEQLERAASDKAHAWRWPVLATVHGEFADARTVVLREVEPRTRRIFIYTDARAGKVSQILHHPMGSMVMWSPALGWQLRCRVRLTLEMSGLAATSRWAHVKLSPAAQDYLSPMPPGAVLVPTSAGAPAPAPTDAETIQHEYFAVIEAVVEAIDWLELHPQGHRRAVFDAQGPRWVQP
jgi:pyridoxamine 5'-phosphate oxidase